MLFSALKILKNVELKIFHIPFTKPAACILPDTDYFRVCFFFNRGLKLLEPTLMNASLYIYA